MPVPVYSTGVNGFSMVACSMLAKQLGRLRSCAYGCGQQMTAAGTRSTVKTKKTVTITAEEAKQTSLTKVLSAYFMSARRTTSTTPNKRDSAIVMTAFVPLPSVKIAMLAAVAGVLVLAFVLLIAT